MFHLLTVKDEHLWVITREEGIRIDVSGFLTQTEQDRESELGSLTHVFNADGM